MDQDWLLTESSWEDEGEGETETAPGRKEKETLMGELENIKNKRTQEINNTI